MEWTMLSDSTLTVLAIASFVLIGLMVVLMGVAAFAAARRRFRAHFQVHRVGSQLMIGSRVASHFQIGDPTRIDGFIAELVKAGRSDEAIQVYQFTKDVGLDDATAAIESLAHAEPQPAPPSIPAPEPT
jgi:hypothetical protein